MIKITTTMMNVITIKHDDDEHRHRNGDENCNDKRPSRRYQLHWKQHYTSNTMILATSKTITNVIHSNVDRIQAKDDDVLQDCVLPSD